MASERLHVLDETWRGRFPGSMMQLCDACLSDSLPQYFSAFRGRAVLLEPSRSSNAYYAYTLGDKDMKIAAGAYDANQTREAIAAVRALQDRISNCDRCGESGAFSWIASAEFKDRWTNVDLEKLAERATSKSLCGGCAGQAVVAGLEALNVGFGEIDPPNDETVLMFSGEA